MKKLTLFLILIVSLTGCQSLATSVIDNTEKAIRLKWAEEWKPELQTELITVIGDSKELILDQVLKEVEHNKEVVKARLEAVNVKIEDFDQNNDGLVTGVESLALLKELKGAKDENGNPLNWYEILMAVVLGYGGTTAGKEFLKSKMIKDAVV